MDFTRIASVKDVSAESPLVITLQGEEIAIFQHEDNYYALCNLCPHREAPLHEGLVEDGALTCPYHFARFDLKTGEVLDGPATRGARKYEVRVQGEDLLIGVAADCSSPSQQS